MKLQGFLQADGVLTEAQLKSMSKKDQAEVRRLLLTDTGFAANHIFRNPSLPALQPFHADIAYSYPQPDPSKHFSAWSPIKERVCLAFRGAAKSTIESAFLAQVILAFPDVRMLLVGATLDKAGITVDIVRGLLNSNPVVAYFWPQVASIPIGKNSFIVPTRSNSSLREPTLAATSFRSCSTGWHGELILMDDCIHEKNQGSEYQVAKSISRYEDLYPMLEPGGYISYTGTRHAVGDIPSKMIEASDKNSTPLSLVVVPIFTVKENQPNQAEINARNKSHKLNLQTDIIPTWLDRWPWQTIASKYQLANFDKNYLLEILEVEPEPVVQSITPELLNKCTTNDVPFDEIPVMNGDLSAVKKTGQDLCGIVGGFYKPETQILVISEIINRKFEDLDVFLRQVWEMHCKFRLLNRVMFRIEDVNGASETWNARFRELNMFADFQLPSHNTNGLFNARDTRVMGLYDAIRAGKIQFDARLLKSPYWRDVLHQFCHYPQLPNDDLIDSAAQLWEYCKTLTAANRVSEIVAPTRKETLLAGCPDPFDNGLPISTPRQGYSDTVHIRRPDVEKPSEPYADPFYARIFSTSNYEKPL